MKQARIFSIERLPNEFEHKIGVEFLIDETKEKPLFLKVLDRFKDNIPMPVIIDDQLFYDKLAKGVFFDTNLKGLNEITCDDQRIPLGDDDAVSLVKQIVDKLGVEAHLCDECSNIIIGKPNMADDMKMCDSCFEHLKSRGG